MHFDLWFQICFVENSLLLCGKRLCLELDNINGSVFEDWFESTLISNLTRERKVKKVLTNAKCHSRLIEDTNHEHEKQWNDRFYAKTWYWNAKSKNGMSLVLCMEKLAVLFHSYLCIIAHPIPQKMVQNKLTYHIKRRYGLKILQKPTALVTETMDDFSLYLNWIKVLLNKYHTTACGY